MKFASDWPTNRVSRLAARIPGGKVRHQLERREEVALDVLPVRRQLRPRPAADDHRQVVVRGPGCEPSVGAKVDLVAPVHRQTAHVGVVADLKRRLLVVLLWLDGACHERVVTVRAHDHPGTLGDGRFALPVPPNAGHAPFLDHDTRDREPLPDLGSRL